MAKKLYRSQHQKVIGGVCGGIAEYFELDPVLVRILLVVSVFAFGTGFLAYIIAMIIIPKQEYVYQEAQNLNNEYAASQNADYSENYQQEKTEYPSKTKKFFALALITIGGLIILDDLISVLDFKYLFPSMLILGGLFLLYNGRNNEGK